MLNRWLFAENGHGYKLFNSSFNIYSNHVALQINKAKSIFLHYSDRSHLLYYGRNFMTTRYNFYSSAVKCYCLYGLNYDHNTCSNMISDLCSTRVNVKRPNCNLLLRCSCTAANFKALSIIALSAQTNDQSHVPRLFEHWSQAILGPYCSRMGRRSEIPGSGIPW